MSEVRVPYGRQAGGGGSFRYCPRCPPPSRPLSVECFAVTLCWTCFVCADPSGPSSVSFCFVVFGEKESQKEREGEREGVSQISQWP